MTDGHRQGWTQYFDTRSAAEYLGLSPKTLEKLRWQGGGPAYYRLGGFATFKMTWTSGVNLVAARAPAIPGRDDQRQSD